MPEKDEEKFTAVEYGASVFDPNYKVAKLNEGKIVLPDGAATIVAVGAQGYHAGPPQSLHRMVVKKYGPDCVFLVYTLYPKNEKLLVFYPKGEMVIGFQAPETWRKNGKRWSPQWSSSSRK